MKKNPIATSMEFLGIAIYSIENDKVECLVGVMSGCPEKHKLKIYYNANEPYIRLYGKRIRLSSFMRV